MNFKNMFAHSQPVYLEETLEKFWRAWLKIFFGGWGLEVVESGSGLRLFCLSSHTDDKYISIWWLS